MSEKLLAGWCEVDLTPDGRVVELYGQYYQRVATGIHSRLKATVLILERGEDASALISLDATAIADEYVRQLQQALAAAVPALRPERIILNATHTHNGAALNTFRDWWQPTPGAITMPEYRALCETALVTAAKKAYADRRPLGMAGVLESARVGHCRRAVYTDGTAEMYGRPDRPDFAGLEGGEDSGVELLFFADESRRPAGVIVNLACPSQVMEATYKISSDFMGALREKLKEDFGPEFRTLPQISAAGCQAPRDLARNYKGEPDFWHEDGVEVIAERLRAAVLRAWPRAAGNLDFAPQLRHLARSIRLPKRRAGYSEYIAAKREIEALEKSQDSHSAYRDFCAEVLANERIPGRPGPYDNKERHFVQIRNREAVVKRYEEQLREPELTIQLHALRLGPVAFATNPFELFLEYGQRIKARSPAGQTFLIQLANGSAAYLPSPRAEQLGGYGGLIINGKVGSDGGTKLVDETIQAMNELFDVASE